MNAPLVLRVASASRVTQQIQRPIHPKSAKKAITVKRARELKTVPTVRRVPTSQSKVAIDASSVHLVTTVRLLARLQSVLLITALRAIGAEIQRRLPSPML